MFQNGFQEAVFPQIHNIPWVLTYLGVYSTNESVLGQPEFIE